MYWHIGAEEARLIFGIALELYEVYHCTERKMLFVLFWGTGKRGATVQYTTL